MKLPQLPKTSVLCTWCKNPTAFTGTKLCDRCYELERRIRYDPELAEAMLTKVKQDRENANALQTNADPGFE